MQAHSGEGNQPITLSSPIHPETRRLTTEAKHVGLEAGLDRVGITTADPFAGVAESLQARRERGYAGRMKFTFAHPEIASDIRATIPWAESLVVGGRSYLPEAGNPGAPEPTTARIARFSTQDWYLPLRQALSEVARFLEDEGYQTEVMVDHTNLVDKAAAVRAGIGWWGKNTLVITPGQGPWMLLGSVVTDARLETDSPMRRNCGTCSACLPACPTGALIAPGVLDASRCLSYLLQAPGDIPRDLRASVGDRLYGCDECLNACPPGFSLSKKSSTRVGRTKLESVLTDTDAALLERYDRFYIPRRDPNFLRRNALVALANSVIATVTQESDPDKVKADRQTGLDLLAPFTHHRKAMLVRHAVWAVGHIGGTEARQLLAEVTARPETAEELELAIQEANTSD